jgi:hypothetical protein
VLASIAAVSSSQPVAGLVLGLPADRRLTVRGGRVRVRVTCSTRSTSELVLLSGAQERIAYKRFTCTPPATTVRLRLNGAGRKLVAHQDRVLAQLYFSAGDRTVQRRVVLREAR